MGPRVATILSAVAVLSALTGCGDSAASGDTSAALADVKANMSTADTPANPQPPQRLPPGVENAGGGKKSGKFAGTGAPQ